MDIAELGEKLAAAGRLNLRPLCVWVADEIPPGAEAFSSVDRCLARAVYTCALYPETPALYLDEAQEGCCPGGMAWMGYADLPPMVKCLKDELPPCPFSSSQPAHLGQGLEQGRSEEHIDDQGSK